MNEGQVSTVLLAAVTLQLDGIVNLRLDLDFQAENSYKGETIAYKLGYNTLNLV